METSDNEIRDAISLIQQDKPEIGLKKLVQTIKDTYPHLAHVEVSFPTT